MNFLIGFAALWVFWLLLPRRSQKLVRIPLLVVIAVTLALSPIGLAFASWGLTAWLPPDSGEPVDAIVTLGRGDAFRDARVVETRQLWDTNRSSSIFISGMLDAKFMVQTLKDTGVPAKALSGEECSQSTEENALFSATILTPKGVNKILLVTDAPHMLRALLTFRRFGFNPIPHPVPLSSVTPPPQYASVLLREYTGLAAYAISGHFKSTAAQALSTNPPTITSRIHDWKCYVGTT